MVTGKEGNRIIRAFNNVRFYKTDMSGNVIQFTLALKTLDKTNKSYTVEWRKPNYW
jgi:hypothetical protein